MYSEGAQERGNIIVHGGEVGVGSNVGDRPRGVNLAAAVAAPGVAFIMSANAVPQERVGNRLVYLLVEDALVAVGVERADLVIESPSRLCCLLVNEKQKDEWVSYRRCQSGSGQCHNR